ncbi:MAG TPA: hypothetical protein VKE42_00210 [Candidatus Cybelea sp.]|nr:hypothetical protein [Candidatus Cybelea sp.]
MHPTPDWFKSQVVARGADSADVREFWQAVARKAAYQEIVSNLLVALMFTIAGAAMLTGICTWIRWALSEL